MSSASAPLRKGPSGPKTPTALPALLQNVVYVAKNGHDADADGSVSKPFLTVQAGMEYAYAAYIEPLGPQPYPGPFTRPTVFVCPGTYDDGPLVLPPQICVEGMGGNFSRVNGDWTIDSRWVEVSGSGNDIRSMFLLMGLYGNVAIDWDAFGSSEGKLWCQGTRFGNGTLTIKQKTANPTSNQAYFQGCEHLGDVALYATNVTMEGPMFTTDPGSVGATLTLNQQGGSSDNFFSVWGGTVGNIVVNAALGGPGYLVRLGHSAQPGATLTLNGPDSTIQVNASARPQPGLIVLGGGAVLGQVVDTNP